MNTKTLLLAELSRATKDKPLYRFDFAEKVGTTERRVRQQIEELRNQGFRVCSYSDGKGYWMAKNEKEYLRLRAEYKARIIKMWGTLAAMDSNIDGQMEMEG